LGWVAVNPTGAPVAVTPPAGLRSAEGAAVEKLTLDGADGVVLFKPKQ
jgi:hypothetical protein